MKPKKEKSLFTFSGEAFLMKFGKATSLGYVKDMETSAVTVARALANIRERLFQATGLAYRSRVVLVGRLQQEMPDGTVTTKKIYES